MTAFIEAERRGNGVDGTVTEVIATVMMKGNQTGDI